MARARSCAPARSAGCSPRARRRGDRPRGTPRRPAQPRGRPRARGRGAGRATFGQDVILCRGRRLGHRHRQGNRARRPLPGRRLGPLLRRGPRPSPRASRPSRASSPSPPPAPRPRRAASSPTTSCASSAALSSELHRPAVSVMDPELTFTPPRLPDGGRRHGHDSHTCGRALTSRRRGPVPVTDGIACAIVRSLVEEAPRALADPADYDARANIMWAGMLAHNDIARPGEKRRPRRPRGRLGEPRPRARALGARRPHHPRGGARRHRPRVDAPRVARGAGALPLVRARRLLGSSPSDPRRGRGVTSRPMRRAPTPSRRRSTRCRTSSSPWACRARLRSSASRRGTGPRRSSRRSRRTRGRRSASSGAWTMEDARQIYESAL